MGQLIRRLWVIFHLILILIVYKTFKEIQKFNFKVAKSIKHVDDDTITQNDKKVFQNFTENIKTTAISPPETGTNKNLERTKKHS